MRKPLYSVTFTVRAASEFHAAGQRERALDGMVRMRRPASGAVPCRHAAPTPQQYLADPGHRPQALQDRGLTRIMHVSRFVQASVLLGRQNYCHGQTGPNLFSMTEQLMQDTNPSTCDCLDCPGAECTCGCQSK